MQCTQHFCIYPIIIVIVFTTPSSNQLPGSPCTHTWFPTPSSPPPHQINYLGPYALTRLLEPVLIRSAPCSVVNLSSIMHRVGDIPDVDAFLHTWEAGGYDESKLANVLFTYEAQRRLGPLGVQVLPCVCVCVCACLVTHVFSTLFTMHTPCIDHHPPLHPPTRPPPTVMCSGPRRGV